jgi:exopolysaccharide biosynthesis polyprenyl glycosylphosphotransferase
MSKRAVARVDGGNLDVRAPSPGVHDQLPSRALTGVPLRSPTTSALGADGGDRSVTDSSVTSRPDQAVIGLPVGGDAARRPHAPARRPRHDVRPPAARSSRRPDPFGAVDDLDLELELAAAGLHPAAPVPADLGPERRLRRVLVGGDLLIATAVWAMVLLIARDTGLGGAAWNVPFQAVAAAGITIAVIHQVHLYRARVSADRRNTRRRLLAACLAAPTAFAIGRLLLGVEAAPVAIAASVAAPWLGLYIGREMFEQWLCSWRLRGRYLRPVVLAGAPDEIRQIAHLLGAHPEAGFKAVGWVGSTPPPPGARAIPDVSGFASPLSADALVHIDHLGDTTDVVGAVWRAGATGVLAGPTAAAGPGFPEVARQLHEQGLHLQMWSGVWGISSRRLRPVALAHEPFFYLERPGSLVRAASVKRAMDVVVASVVLVAASPVLAVAAALIKLHDRGPVLFRQKRVGLHGEIFELRKLRTMGVDAEARLERLKAANERSGPLFKLGADPRVTPIGKVLRATSIDELPQLLDVLAGRLSLVGPRPALPSEVAEFDRALLDRHKVLPGLTGLWQAEARHNPSFDAYRHLDLFYVENWTVVLDVLILLATVRTVLSDTVRAGTSFVRRRLVR